MFKEKARENKVLSGILYGENHVKQEVLTTLSKPLTPINTRQELSKIAKVGHGTLDKVKIIEEKAAPEIKEKLSIGDISINQAYKDIKSVEKQEQLEIKKQEIIAKQLNISTGKLAQAEIVI